MNANKTTLNRTEPNRTVDFLKGIAILFVIITHFSWTEKERSLLLFPYWIDMAVPIFMFLSGYVNAVALKKRNINSIEYCYSQKYVLKKLLRYGAPFLIFYIVEQVLFSIKDWGFSTLERFLQFFNGGIGQGSYYLPIMMQFIFIFPVIFFVVKKYEEIGVVFFFGTNLLYEVIKSSYMMNEECYRVLVLRYIFVIAAGCLLAVNEKKILKLKYSLVLTLVGAIYIYLVMYTNYHPIIFTYWTGRSLFGCMFIVPIIGRLVDKNRVKLLILEVLGKASYHILFVQMLYYLTIGNIIDDVISRPMALVVGIGICCILGFVFYLIESAVTKKIISKIGV